MIFNNNQYDIFNDRYALKGVDGEQLEDEPEQMFRRVAKAIANNPQEEEDFYDILNRMGLVPGGRILSGAGAQSGKTFYNCYVIPVETSARRENRDKSRGYHTQRKDHGSDSREAIMDTINTMVGIMSRGGGVGINWSVLRPNGTYLSRVSGTTSGPVSWMHVASTAVGVVEQGGTRRGAAMFMLDDWHPDLLEFINKKKKKGYITNANVSVAVSDEFMKAVKEDGEWVLRFPDTSHKAYDTEWTGDLVSWERAGYPVVDHQRLNARTLWGNLTDAAHASGEPGIVFLGRYNALSTANGQERIICVNPCGEQGLGAYSVCNLGSMNLDAYCVNGNFLWGQFQRDVRTAVLFLDNVIDKDMYFVPETEIQQKRLRRMGLGVMGLADALVHLGLRYGSDAAIRFTEDVFRTMRDEAIEESARLAYEKGPALAWDDSMWNRPYLKDYIKDYGMPIHYENGMRNLFLLTQAPTGTTSLFAGVNSGIEPYFAMKTFRKDRTGSRVVYPKAIEEMRQSWVEQTGQHPDDMPDMDYMVTSQDVTVEEHIDMQAAVQRYIDSSVSKTVNAPKDQSPEETAKAYMMAYDSGLKGLAYYRDGSRDEQVLHHEDPDEEIKRLKEEVATLKAKANSPWRASLVIDTVEETVAALCPDCDYSELVFEEGCKKCHNCGYSAC